MSSSSYRPRAHAHAHRPRPHHSPSRSRSRSTRRSVRFQDNPPTYTPDPLSSSIASSSTHPSPSPVPPVYDPYSFQPGPTRQASLPTRPRTSSFSREARQRGLDALSDLRRHLKDACNFHGDHLRKALTVPSLSALFALTSFVNALRNVDPNLSHHHQSTLLALINPSRRHPHELLQQPTPSATASKYQRNAERAHMKRCRREAEHHLLVFVSRQLQLPIPLLKEQSPQMRAQRELDAFKERIRRFNGLAASIASPSYVPAGTHSAPHSPAYRIPTLARSPRSVPIGEVRHPQQLTAKSMDHLIMEMAELNLPGSSFDAAAPSPALYDNLPTMPGSSVTHQSPQHRPVASPYASPYVGMRPSHNVYPTTVPAQVPVAQAPVAPQPVQGASSPYARPMPAPSSPYAHPMPGPAPTQPMHNVHNHPIQNPTHLSPSISSAPTPSPYLGPNVGGVPVLSPYVPQGTPGPPTASPYLGAVHPSGPPAHPTTSYVGNTVPPAPAPGPIPAPATPLTASPYAPPSAAVAGPAPANYPQADATAATSGAPMPGAPSTSAGRGHYRRLADGRQ